MKKLLSALQLFLFSGTLLSQSAADLAVQMSAAVQNNPPQITLSWIANTTTSQYLVYRKLKTAITWGAPVATLAGNVNQYTDNTASTGISYEYRVVRNSAGYTGYGYINSGIEIPETDFRGKLILMVDSAFNVALAPEITRLIRDMEGDGWEVTRHDVLRTGSVMHIKDLIVSDYSLDPANTKAVFLLGHVPVPYSGNINPDAHGDHLGAWPADCYYADMDGLWTDNTVNSTTLSPPRTQNIPGDGKFDQSIAPTDLELQVGRVDFNDMPAFAATEQQLLKNYLDKDHDYRKKIFSPVKRAVVDDNFGYFTGEAFAASGYKNFAPLTGTANVLSADYFTTMTGNSYLWSFGCGGGTYTSASGIGTTANFAAANLQGVFTMVFGSYFGDWDSQNNFLRAALAQGRVLTNVWSGRPHYQFHHMALGENIGYGLLLTQNNPGNLYFASPTGITGRWVHNALMGDPTLRNDVLSPVSNVIATKSGYDCLISWSASPEAGIAGYNVYMKNDSNSSYVKINNTLVTGTTYTDNCLLYKGIYTYMVRSVKLENTPSGTYYNMSEGISDTAYNSSNLKIHAGFNTTISGGTVTFNNTSSNASSYFWDFGNGVTSTSLSPVINYNSNSAFLITLVAMNDCNTDTVMDVIAITEVGLGESDLENALTIFPNPTHGRITIHSDLNDPMTLVLYNCEGRMVREQTLFNQEEIDLSMLAKGIYLAQIKTGGYSISRKIILE